MRFSIHICLSVMLGLMAASHSASATPAVDTLMCDDAPAGFVKPVPAPFRFWMVVVCGPQSQALVPIEGMMWMTPHSDEPISILALPPGSTSLPKTPDYDPSYAVRFKSFFAAESKGEKFERAMSLLTTMRSNNQISMSAEQAESIGRVFQLDAISNIYDVRYNIYFYIIGEVPKAAIVCLDACHQVLAFDILSIQEAAMRGAARR